MSKETTISIYPARIGFFLSVIAVFLVAVNTCGQLLKYRYGMDVSRFLPTFDLSLEQNIPTFYTVLLMLIISLLTGVVSYLNHMRQKEYTTKWIALSVGFLYMAYDEGFHVHEDLVGLIRPMLWEGRLGIFYYAWVIPGIILVFLLFLFFFRFLKFLSDRIRTLFLASAVIYLTGVIGMELVGGYYDEIHGMQNLKYNLISALEESLEIAGLIFFIYALFEYISKEYPVILLSCKNH